MAKKLIVEVIGKTDNLAKEFQKGSRATESFERDLKSLGVTAEQSAQAQINAAIKKDARLREQVAAYRQIAAAAAKGSREEVAAANLAARAQSQLARSLAATTRETRESAQAAEKANRQFSQFGRGALAGSGALRGLGRNLAFASAGFLSAAGAVQLLRSSISVASNLAEQTSKANVVFGEGSKVVEEWSKTTAKSLGLASDQALETAGSIGALLRPIGITGNAAAEQSVKLTKLGADLASFYNTSVQDALDAIRSGLVGEVEPLRRYGVLLSETRVQQEALVETGKTHASQLTAAEKLLARQTLIYKDTSQAQGDFARTSGGLANQQRTLTANLRDLQSVLGQALVPSLTTTITKLNLWLESSDNQKRVQQDINSAAHTAIGIVGALARTYDAAAESAGKFAGALERADHLLGGGGKEHESALQRQLAKDIAAYKTLLALQQASFDLIEGARQGDRFTRTFKLPGAGGTSFVGRPLTKQEQLNITLAGNPDDIGALREQRAKKQRALDFALKQIREEKGNTKKFAQEAAKLSGEITDITQHLASIKSSHDAAVKKKSDDAKSKAEAAADALIAALQFNVTKAQATATLRDDGPALDALLAGIRARIAKEGPLLELKQQEFTVLGQITDLASQKGQAALTKSANVVDALRLRLSRAQATKGFGDDLKVLGLIDKGIRAEIVQAKKIGASTADLQTQLFQNSQDTKETRAERKQSRKDARQSSQFKALGLTGAGDERVPTAKSLRTQLGKVATAVQGTILDTKANRNLFATIRRDLGRDLDKTTDLTKRKIKELLDALSGDTPKGPLTKTAGLNTKKLTAGLGLTPDQIRTLRARASGANSDGRVRADAPRAPARGGFVGGRPIVVENHTTVVLDGQTLSKAVTRNQQKTRSRNPAQRRGPNRGLQ